MRVFIAIDIDEQIRKGIRSLQKKLQNSVDIRKSDVKWVEPNNIHLTLKFLGEIKDEKVTEICNITRDVAGRHSSFDIDVGSVGCFGGKAPKVLWVGTGKNNENLLQLQNDLEEQLASAGWPKETRAFSGHLTLCRIRNPQAGSKLAMVSEGYRDFNLGLTSADLLSVYQSQLTPKGPVYTLLGDYKLKT